MVATPHPGRNRQRMRMPFSHRAQATAGRIPDFCRWIRGRVAGSRTSPQRERNAVGTTSRLIVPHPTSVSHTIRLIAPGMPRGLHVPCLRNSWSRRDTTSGGMPTGIHCGAPVEHPVRHCEHVSRFSSRSSSRALCQIAGARNAAWITWVSAGSTPAIRKDESVHSCPVAPRTLKTRVRNAVGSTSGYTGSGSTPGEAHLSATWSGRESARMRTFRLLIERNAARTTFQMRRLPGSTPGRGRKAA